VKNPIAAEITVYLFSNHFLSLGSNSNQN